MEGYVCGLPNCVKNFPHRSANTPRVNARKLSYPRCFEIHGPRTLPGYPRVEHPSFRWAWSSAIFISSVRGHPPWRVAADSRRPDGRMWKNLISSDCRAGNRAVVNAPVAGRTLALRHRSFERSSCQHVIGWHAQLEPTVSWKDLLALPRCLPRRSCRAFQTRCQFSSRSHWAEYRRRRSRQSR
jgi:hypothetical protein